MHLTVTQWRSLFPMAQKSGVSEIAAPVPLETGKKKKKRCCVHADARFTIQHFDFVPYAMLLQHYFPRFIQHMNTRKT